MNQRYFLPGYVCLLVLSGLLLTGCNTTQPGTISLFDGETLNGWRASENPSSWQVEDGALVTKGPRSHLFYIGNGEEPSFKNFEFAAEVKTESNSNSGIYFHTEYQEEGWPAKGYECQVLNSTLPAGQDQYRERRMTGSLYAIRNLYKTPVTDGEWFRYRIMVQGKTIRVYINDQLMVDYTEPEKPYRPEDKQGRLLSSGTFALQCHDPDSRVYFRNIQVKRLPDDLKTPGTPLADTAFASRLIRHADRQTPLMDLHGHLKAGLTLDQTLAHARKYGFTYGIAFNCGLKMGFETDDSLRTFLAGYQQPPQTYLAVQAEGREWLDLFSPETIGMADYVFTDAMTWTNDKGRRMRLWIPEETEVGDPQDFMEQLVDRTVKIIRNEPIDIYVNATYLPGEINDRYDELWTEERMDRVIAALVESGVALEISARFRIPSAAFIKRARSAGVLFTMGTNNTSGEDLGRLEYCLDMVEECALTYHDFWFPE